MAYDPNFPTDLSIVPSTPSGDAAQSDANCSQDAFSSSAQLASIKKYGIAGRVWEASYPLLYYLTDKTSIFDPPLIIRSDQSLTLLELGAGTGIVTSRIILSLANRTSDIVIATDLPEVCPLLDANINGVSYTQPLGRKALVRPLAWGNADHAVQIAKELGLVSSSSQYASYASEPRYLTHIICSDLVYFPELLAPLLRTLIQLTSPPFTVPESHLARDEDRLQIIISYKVRSLSKETAFWSAFGLWFHFEPVMIKHAGDPAGLNAGVEHGWKQLGTSIDAFVFIARRRPESQAWTLPNRDCDLISGVGAWATQSSKCDDTFETLLLMGLDEGDEEVK